MQKSDTLLTTTEMHAGRNRRSERLKRQKLRTDGDGKLSSAVLMTTCCVPHIMATALRNRKLFDSNGFLAGDIAVDSLVDSAFCEKGRKFLDIPDSFSMTSTSRLMTVP